MTERLSDYIDYPTEINVVVPMEEADAYPSLPLAGLVKEGATHMKHTLLLGADYAPGKRLYRERRWAVVDPIEYLADPAAEQLMTASDYRALLEEQRVPAAPAESALGEPIILFVASEKYTAVVRRGADQAQVTLIKTARKLEIAQTLPTGNELAERLQPPLQPHVFAHLREDVGIFRGRVGGIPLQAFLSPIQVRQKARQRFNHIPDGQIIDTVRAPLVR